VAGAGVLLAGVVFGFKGGRGAAARRTSARPGTWLRVGEKEQVTLTYNTLRLGAKTLDALKEERADLRAMWADRLPNSSTAP